MTDSAVPDDLFFVANRSAPAFKWLSLLGSLTLVLGPFFPWAFVWISGLVYSQNVMDGLPDAIFIFCAGVLIFSLGVVRLATTIRDAVLWTQLIVASIIGWVVVLDIDSASTSAYRVDLGPGMWVSLAGAVVVAVGSLPVVAALFTQEGSELREHRRLAATERMETRRNDRAKADAAHQDAEAKRQAELQRLRSKYDR